jgi:Uma2 family endonuclease
MSLAYQEHYTFEDYQLWDGDWELIKGMPYAMTPSPSVTHQTVTGNIFAEIKKRISSFSEVCGDCYVLMETDWRIANDTVVRPDVILVCHKLEEYVMVTPELVIEIVSSSSTKRDEVMKFDLYQREGVSYYILAYPEKRLAKIYKNGPSGFIKQGDFSTQIFSFTVGECVFDLDFDTIWRNK